jgi:predicted GNAT family acetyltransferase
MGDFLGTYDRAIPASFPTCLSPSDDAQQGRCASMPDRTPPVHARSPDHEQLIQQQVTRMTVRDNKERARFEFEVEGSVAFANYRRRGNAVIITHTETPVALRGRGIGSELVKGALELIRADGHKVMAGCSFVADYLEQHAEYADIVA